MKWTNRVLAFAAILTVSAIAAIAQTQECTDDFKTATYTKWYDNRVEHQDVAYQAATDYVTVCPNDSDSQYFKALKKFKDAYEALNANKKLGSDFACRHRCDCFPVARGVVLPGHGSRPPCLALRTADVVPGR